MRETFARWKWLGCVHVRKHHLPVNCGDAIRALPGAERQSDRDHDRQNRRSQSTGACLLRVRYSSPKYLDRADGQVNRVSFLSSKTVPTVRPTYLFAML